MNSISPERWNQIDAFFAEALDLPAEERRAFVEQACGDDLDLYRRVLALLDSEVISERVLGESVTEYAAPLLSGLQARFAADLADDLPENGRIGPYQVLHEIGRGGMGTVYAAERDDEHFRKRVALKLVKRGMDSAEILRRFRYERQILASLEHPNIARLYDGGVTGDGRPYLVMEYVGGRTIDRYCDDEELSIDQRLELFGSVCEAVRYAHRSLVVHRDLKPSNILVTEDGTVKLLDFGIAKLLSDEVAPLSAPVTQTGIRVMTLEYASPEQVRGAPVTTASDAYSLGIVLYELLTGHRPFELAGKAPAEAERAVLSGNPEAPSTAVTRAKVRRRRDGTTETVTPEKISSARRTRPDRLQRRLRGDLDTILLTALRKEPERRYGSAEAFLVDIKRHLAGLPITARPDTPWYRTTKFVRRHKVGVVAAVLVVLSTLAGLGTALWQAEQTRRERDTAQQIATFLEELFQSSDPFADDSERIDTLRIRDVLARGVTSVQHELTEQPPVQARLLNVIGNVYRNLGLYHEAMPLLTQALDGRHALYGRTHAEVAESQRDLASVHIALGGYAAADSLYRQAISTQRAILGADHPEVSESLLGLAEVLRLKGAYGDAEPYYRQAIDIRRSYYGDKHVVVAEGLSLMATMLWNKGDREAAEPLLREALDTYRVVLGPQHPSVIQTMGSLAGVLQHQGDFAGAEALLQEALTTSRSMLGPEHPRTVQTLHSLAVLYEDVSRYDDAELLLREILTIRRSRFGANHREVASALNELALVLRDKGEYDSAEPYAREALSIFRTVFGTAHPELATSMSILGSILMEKKELGEAESLFRTSLDMRRRILGVNHRDTGMGITHLAELLRSQGNYSESEALYREVLAREPDGDDHPGIAIVSGLLANVLQDAGRYAEAESAYRDALRRMEKALPAGHVRVARALVGLGLCLTALRRFEEAETHLLEAYAAFPREQKLDIQRVLRGLVELHVQWNKPSEAARYDLLLAEAHLSP